MHKLLAPGQGPDDAGCEAEPENDPHREGHSPDPDGISFAELFRQPPSFGRSVNEPMVVAKGGGTEERDCASDKQLRANQGS